MGEKDVKKQKKKRRENTLKKLTRNLGEIKETEQKIEVYVKQENLDKLFQYEDNKREIKKYDLGNDMVYYFEGINFENRIVINQNIKSIFFKDCTFESFIEINEVQEVEFVNNRYRDNMVSRYKGISSFFIVNGVDSLRFKKEDIISDYEEQVREVKPMQIEAKKVELEDSKINTAIITADEVVLKNSVLKSRLLNTKREVRKIGDSEIINSTIPIIEEYEK